MDGDLLRPGWSCYRLKIFKPSEENPYLCGREQCRPEDFTVHVICCVVFVLLGDSK